MTERIMGIDYNGYSICYSIFDDGVFQLSGKMESPDMKELLTEYGRFLGKMHVNVMAIERIYIGPNAMSTKKLAKIHGGICWESLRNDVEVSELYVAHWKSKILGTHRASKREALVKANELFGPDIVDHNVADACLIGLCAYQEREAKRAAPTG
jgi:Holliday junction resolvasome RuvABC endonuclease subunit